MTTITDKDRAEHETDERFDRSRFGGPVTSGMVMTLLRAHRTDAYDDRAIHQLFDCEAIARAINSWLIPIPQQTDDRALGMQSPAGASPETQRTT